MTYRIRYKSSDYYELFPCCGCFTARIKIWGETGRLTLEIQKGHNIVDAGVYKYIRHPIYSAIWLWVIIEALLLNNYIAGLSGLIRFGYKIQINRGIRNLFDS